MGERQRTVEQVVRAYFDGINAERYAEVGALFAPAGQFRAPGVDVLRGAGPVADHFAGAFRHYREHADTPVRIVVAGTTAVAEVRFTGVLDSGTRIAFEAVDVFDLDADGAIVQVRCWFDSHRVRSLLRADRVG